MGTISAASVEDRTAYVWEQWDVEANLNPGWYSDLTIGPCKLWRTRYAVLLNCCLRKDAPYYGDVWEEVVTLPVGWRPQFELWDARMSVEQLGSSALFDVHLRSDGVLRVNEKSGTLDWQVHTRIPVYFSYPRSNN